MRRFSVFATLLSFALALPVFANEGAEAAKADAPKVEHKDQGKHKGHAKKAEKAKKAEMPAPESAQAPTAAAPAAPAPAAAGANN